MKTKNILDERQEQELLKIEHNACWIAWLSLLAAIIIQGALETGGSLKNVPSWLGEWIIFMSLSIYIACGCMKQGIWSRTLEPNAKTNAAMSAVAGAVIGVFMALAIYFRSGNIEASAILGGGCFAGTFLICFFILSVSVKRLRKIQKKLEEGEE